MLAQRYHQNLQQKLWVLPNGKYKNHEIEVYKIYPSQEDQSDV